MAVGVERPLTPAVLEALRDEFEDPGKQASLNEPAGPPPPRRRVSVGAPQTLPRGLRARQEDPFVRAQPVRTRAGMGGQLHRRTGEGQWHLGVGKVKGHRETLVAVDAVEGEYLGGYVVACGIVTRVQR